MWLVQPWLSHQQERRRWLNHRVAPESPSGHLTIGEKPGSASPKCTPAHFTRSLQQPLFPFFPHLRNAFSCPRPPPILFSRLPLSLCPSFETPPSRPLPFLYSILRDPCLFSGPGDTGVNTHPPTWLLLVDSPHSSHTDPISLLELPVHWARFSCGMHFPIVSSLLCLAGLAAVPVSGYGGNDPDIKAIPVSQALPRSCA